MISLSPASKASDSSTASDVMKYLSCESGYLATLGNGNISPNSCIQVPLLLQTFLAVITSNASLATVIRLKINDENIYPGNCLRDNRENSSNLTLTYGFCNNILLAMKNVEAGFDSAISGRWKFPDPKEYTIMKNEPSGYTDIMVDMSYIPTGVGGMQGAGPSTPSIAIFYRVQKVQDRICVQMLVPTLFSFVSLGCKYTTEPFKQSYYEEYNPCAGTVDCSRRIQAASQTLTPIIGTLVTCIRGMIISNIVEDRVCVPVNSNTSEGSAEAISASFTTQSLLHKFQNNMYLFVTALLTLYTMIFGIKMMLAPDSIEQKDLPYFILKFLLVTYFSVGINMNGTNFDGITSWVFPFVFAGINDMGGWMMAAASVNGLCDFSSQADSNTEEGISLALWDQIDCRLATYLGYDGLVEMMMGITWSNDPVGHQIPPYILIAIPALFFGCIPLVILALSYPIMIISLVGYALAMYVNSMIIVTVLGVLAPIFVPMALFDYTYKYFDKWWRIFLSCMIQCTIAILFLTVFFVVFDKAFYSTCVYKPVNINYFSSDGSGTTKKQYKTFYISYNASDYRSKGALDQCINSLGSFMNGGAELNYTPPESVDIHTYANFEDRIAHTDEDVLSGFTRPRLGWTDGLFTKSPKVAWESLMELTKNFIICALVLWLMQHLLSSIPSMMSKLSGSSVQGAGVFNVEKMSNIIHEGARDRVGHAAKYVQEARENLKGRGLFESVGRGVASGAGRVYKSLGSLRSRGTVDSNSGNKGQE